MVIRNVGNSVRLCLESRARANNRSMKAEVRVLLAQYLDEPTNGLGSRVQARFQALGAVEFDIPPRTEQMRDVDFG